MRPNKADYIHSTAHCKLEIMEKQPDLYVGEKTDDFLQTVQEFAWISSFRTCRKASENETVLVESSEIHEPIPGTQIVTHDAVFPLV